MSSNARRLRWLAAGVFITAIAVFTWKLLQPQPIPVDILRGMSSWSAVLPFLVAKAAHLFGYAFLTVVGGLVSPRRWWRNAIVIGLLLHAVGTEIGQTFVPNRTGKFTDVMIDTFGVAIGVVVLRRSKALAHAK